MNVWIFLIPWILVGLGVIFVAFSGGPGRARQARAQLREPGLRDGRADLKWPGGRAGS